MLVLVLAIASSLLFFAIVLSLWIAEVLEARGIHNKKILIPARPFLLLSIAEAFDPVYSTLWDAPVAALQLINSAGRAGLSVARLQPMYKKAASSFPEIYDGCNFVQWVQFLEEMRLISWHGDAVVLTPDGKDFLRFRFVTDAMVEA